MTSRGKTLVVCVAVVATFLHATTASAQIVGTAHGLGAGHALASTAAGYEAGLYNPAGLASGGFTATALGVSGAGRLSPIGPRRLSSYGAFLDPTAKAEIVEAIERAGGSTVHARAGLHLLGISRGGYALNVMTSGAAEATLSPRAAELLLYGNVGRTGDAEAFTFEETRGRAHVVTTIALSHGRSVPAPLPGRMAVGATVRYGVVHLLADGRDGGSALVNDPLDLVVNGSAVLARNGHRWGLDLGARWSHGRWSAGLVARDLVAGHRFAEDATELTTFAAAATIEGRASDTTYSVAYRELSSAERSMVEARLAEPLASTRLVGAVARDFGRVTPFGELSVGSSSSDQGPAELTLGATTRPIRAVRVNAALSLGDAARSLAAGFSVRALGIVVNAGGAHEFGRREGWGGAIQVGFGV